MDVPSNALSWVSSSVARDIQISRYLILATLTVCLVLFGPTILDKLIAVSRVDVVLPSNLVDSQRYIHLEEGMELLG